MTLSQSPNHDAWVEFDSMTCPVCKHAKKKASSFCGKCYFKLDADMRQALYKRFGSGYEEAYSEAKDYLTGELKANE